MDLGSCPLFSWYLLVTITANCVLLFLLGRCFSWRESCWRDPVQQCFQEMCCCCFLRLVSAFYSFWAAIVAVSWCEDGSIPVVIGSIFPRWVCCQRRCFVVVMYKAVFFALVIPGKLLFPFLLPCWYVLGSHISGSLLIFIFS